jgi:hypothetical protein
VYTTCKEEWKVLGIKTFCTKYKVMEVDVVSHDSAGLVQSRWRDVLRRWERSMAGAACGSRSGVSANYTR